MFAKLKSKFHVYFICRIPTTHGTSDSGDIPNYMLEKWIRWVGFDNILRLPEAKAVVDMMLGALSIKAGTRTWETYHADLKTRGQEPARMKNVYEALHHKTAPPGMFQ